MFNNKIKYAIWKLICSQYGLLLFSKFPYGQYLQQVGRGKIKQKVLKKCYSDFVVKEGPFKNLKLNGSDFFIDSILPKLSGTYEFEIQLIINQIISKKFNNIINIGCGEGYYVVGLALKIPNSRIIGFEIENDNRNRSLKLAQLNKVSDRIKIFGKADEAALLNLEMNDDLLILSDCEGAELDIFTLEVIGKYKHADFLIETHDCYRPGLTDELQKRFGSSHEVKTIHFIPNKDRTEFIFPTCHISPLERFYLSEERREEGNGWIYCKAKK